jgi:hypothetical protein
MLNIFPGFHLLGCGGQSQKTAIVIREGNGREHFHTALEINGVHEH